ncbi:MAG: 50S ribosomal protein L10 [Candidatus Nanohaloarchaea archaeon]|nr:50S ribosomal protein L10 [Candidatus Nanohaloarchaea archaeon]
MQLTRKEKEETVTVLEEKMEDYPVIGILDMHSLPARQLQEIKKELVDEAEITMARKTLIELALEEADREGIEQLEENDAVQPALIFTQKNPFSLFKLIQEKKSSAAASGGEEAPSDIVIESGMTDLDPGPMLGKIQEMGAGTSVEDGKIKV